MLRPDVTLPRLALALLALAACSKAPPEPDAAPASSAAQAPAVPPLTWDAPGSWARLPTPPSGANKASYRLDKVGNDKEEATLEVFYPGLKSDPPAAFKEWLSQFDGDAAQLAKRDAFAVRDFAVETVEMSGTYKVALTPPARGRKAAPVQMVKNGFRLLGAVIKTKDRGNWFFKMVGPDETVQAARSSFRTMLESAR
jgi:hypothetical protein